MIIDLLLRCKKDLVENTPYRCYPDCQDCTEINCIIMDICAEIQHQQELLPIPQCKDCINEIDKGIMDVSPCSDCNEYHANFRQKSFIDCTLCLNNGKHSICIECTDDNSLYDEAQKDNDFLKIKPLLNAITIRTEEIRHEKICKFHDYLNCSLDDILFNLCNGVASGLCIHSTYKHVKP